MNVWSDPSKTGASQALQMAAFLEERSHTRDMQEVNAALCEFVNPQPGEHILEVGSGTGVLCRLMAPAALPAGQMVGIDISPHMVWQAHKYATELGAEGRTGYASGAGEWLPFEAGGFDVALAARLLLHVRNPDEVLNELRRVVRRGGRVVVMDWDFETVVVDVPERELTRRVLHWRTDHHGGDNWSGRQLWRRMLKAGFQRLTIRPVVTLAQEEGDSLTQSLLRAAQGARDAEAISEEEYGVWVEGLKQRIQEQTFFASIVYFMVKGFVV